jgi:SAM-dependent methyltransferase
MDLADNYHRWILDYFQPHLGTRIVEVGAGTGSISRLIAERGLVHLFMIEPAVELIPALEQNAAGLKTISATTSSGFLHEAIEEVREFGPDTFVYVNVFEHVEDDIGELKRVFDLLPAGGTLCVFVPALPFLYSKFDKSIDHFRRYTLNEMRAKAGDAGFDVVLSRYFDFVGIFPWLVKFRLLGSTSLDTTAVSLYDRFVVPIASRIERFVKPPIGKNVLLVARKPPSAD